MIKLYTCLLLLLLLSFIVPIIILRKDRAIFHSNESLYKRLAISAIAPSLLTLVLMHIYANVYHDDMLSAPTLMRTLFMLYGIFMFSVWLYLPKTDMDTGWKIICWALRAFPIFIYLFLISILLVMLAPPSPN